MQLEGKILLKAPLQKIWNSMLEPDILSACVPGVESLEKTDEKIYEGVIIVKLGPFKFKIKGVITWVEFEPTSHLKGSINGTALGGMGTVMGDMIIDMNEVQKDEVELTYKMSLNIVGKLSAAGDRMMRAKAKSMEAEMTKNFQEKLV